MKRILLVAGVTGAMLVGAAVVRTAQPAVDARRDASIVTSFGPIESHHGWLMGEVVEYSSLDSSAARWVVRLETTRNRRVVRARVRVTAFMPEDSTVRSALATARYLGRGRYEITGLPLNRAGWWNVGLAIEYRGRSDSLAFNLLLPSERKGR